MNNKIVLKEGTTLSGVNNIVISELDGTVFINNSVQVEGSIKGALSFYTEDGLSLSGSGPSLIWDKYEELLESKNFKSTFISADSTKTISLETSKLIVSDFSKIFKLSVSKWIGFESKLHQGTHPYTLNVNVLAGQETLCFLTNDYTTETTKKISLALDKDRFYIKTALNIRQRTIINSIGSVTDNVGDVAIDENYFYYCVGKFDGINKIWRRSQLTEW